MSDKKVGWEASLENLRLIAGVEFYAQIGTKIVELQTKNKDLELHQQLHDRIFARQALLIKQKCTDAALPPAMTWTTQKPTKEGFYWHRGTHPTWVCEVKWDAGELIAEWGTPIAHCHDGDWAGPIAPPMEPPQ